MKQTAGMVACLLVQVKTRGSATTETQANLYSGQVFLEGGSQHILGLGVNWQ